MLPFLLISRRTYLKHFVTAIIRLLPRWSHQARLLACLCAMVWPNSLGPPLCFVVAYTFTFHPFPGLELFRTCAVCRERSVVEVVAVNIVAMTYFCLCALVQDATRGLLDLVYHFLLRLSRVHRLPPRTVSAYLFVAILEKRETGGDREIKIVREGGKETEREGGGRGREREREARSSDT